MRPELIVANVGVANSAILEKYNQESCHSNFGIMLSREGSFRASR
jgi:hypothetical protein